MIMFDECPVCRNRNIEYHNTFPSRFREKKDFFDYYKCSECLTIFQNPMLEENELSDDYRKMPDIRTRMSEGISGYLRKKFDNFICSDLKKFFKKICSDKNVLDYGAGDGLLLDLIINKNNLYAYEINENCRKILTEKKYIIVDDLKTNIRTYNFIICYGVLEHMHNPGEWIKQISEYHDIQGKLLVAVPDIESWQSKLFGKHWAALYAPQHLYFYNRKSLIELFRKSGYTSIKQIMFDRRSDPFLFVTSLFRNLDPNIIMNDETANKITVHRKAMFLILYFIFYLPVKIVNLLTGRPALLILLLSKEKKTDVCR